MISTPGSLWSCHVVISQWPSPAHWNLDRKKGTRDLALFWSNEWNDKIQCFSKLGPLGALRVWSWIWNPSHPKTTQTIDECLAISVSPGITRPPLSRSVSCESHFVLLFLAGADHMFGGGPAGFSGGKGFGRSSCCGIMRGGPLASMINLSFVEENDSKFFLRGTDLRGSQWWPNSASRRKQSALRWIGLVTVHGPAKLACHQLRTLGVPVQCCGNLPRILSPGLYHFTSIHFVHLWCFRQSPDTTQLHTYTHIHTHTPDSKSPSQQYLLFSVENSCFCSGKKIPLVSWKYPQTQGLWSSTLFLWCFNFTLHRNHLHEQS